MQRAARWGAILAVAAAAIVEMGPAVARADSSETELREAKLRFDEGIVRVQAGDLEGARRSFQQSLAVTPTQSAMFNLALVEERTGRTLEALAHFRQYIQRYALGSEERAQVQKHVTDLSEKTGHIDVQAPYGTVLSLDGMANAGTTPLAEPLDVAPGRHVIEARLPQGSKLQAVDALAGQVARVSFGDEGVSSGALPGLTPEDGADARAAGAASSQAAERPAPAVSTAARTRIVTVAAIGGAAVASGLVGLYFGLQSNQDAKTFKELQNDRTCDHCTQLTDALNAANTEHAWADALLVTGGVLAVAAVGTWFFWPKATSSSVQLAPTAGPSAIGAVAVGTF
jgi:hypothetical protein